MKARFALSQVQRQILAPVMQQSITVLLLPITDLEAAIEQELQSNPLLEAAEITSTGDFSSQKNDNIQKSIEKYTLKQDNLPFSTQQEDEESEEKPIAREQTLEEYLFRQLKLEISDELKLKIGELIIGNIDEDGYLRISCEEIALILELPDAVLVEEILSLIQSFDPTGVAARNLKECLLIQLKAKGQNGEITSAVVNEHLEDLGKKRFTDIARTLQIPVEQVQEIAHWISLLDPKPARNYRPINGSIYIKPDVFITYDSETGYEVHVNDSHIPQLRMNVTYKNMLNRTDLKDDERAFIREKLENALCFIKSVEQRGQTLREITKYILDKQKEFFDGNHLALVPLTLKDAALALDRNESTISRAVNNKYVDTPQGLFALKYFFSQALPTETNGNTSSQSIKEEIKDIIGQENKSSPLSDQDIQNHFCGKGVHLARRTIAKYREALQIPASYLRKNTHYHKN